MRLTGYGELPEFYPQDQRNNLSISLSALQMSLVFAALY